MIGSIQSKFWERSSGHDTAKQDWWASWVFKTSSTAICCLRDPSASHLPSTCFMVLVTWPSTLWFAFWYRCCLPVSCTRSIQRSPSKCWGHWGNLCCSMINSLYLLTLYYTRPRLGLGLSWLSISQNHPVTDLPAFFIHPCGTKEAMEQFNCLLKDYLGVWLGLVGGYIGLWLPPAMAWHKLANNVTYFFAGKRTFKYASRLQGTWARRGLVEISSRIGWSWVFFDNRFGD